ncbi:MAG: tyrosine-type recombinase/integrase [Planctomycetota bacterium]|jgi:site-specific recombinase XerD
MVNADYKITEEKYLNDKEQAKLLKFCREKAQLDLMQGRHTWVTRNMLVLLAFKSGLRSHELAQLKIKDIRIGKDDEPHLYVGNGKRGKSRDVTLADDIVKDLKKYIDYKKMIEQSIEPEAPLFAGRTGKHCTPVTLQISFKKAVQQSGINKKYSIHSARHSFATNTLYNTQNLIFVQQQLGHSSLNMTSLYSGIKSSEKRKLANMVRD